VSPAGAPTAAFSQPTKGLDHEIVILAHLVQMVKIVRNLRDEDIANRLGLSLDEAAEMLSESANPTFDQLRQLFLAVGMDTAGIFETSPGHPEKTSLSPLGFGVAIERGLEILDREGPAAAEAG
jgi:transcriptional regulator with XRE-family HTH domain